jgi:hypothetical protein
MPEIVALGSEKSLKCLKLGVPKVEVRILILLTPGTPGNLGAFFLLYKIFYLIINELV